MGMKLYTFDVVTGKRSEKPVHIIPDCPIGWGRKDIDKYLEARGLVNLQYSRLEWEYGRIRQ